MSFHVICAIKHRNPLKDLSFRLASEVSKYVLISPIFPEACKGIFTIFGFGIFLVDVINCYKF